MTRGRVSIFVTCIIDQIFPAVGMAMTEVLERLGYEVDFREQQTCCGQPAFNTGYWDEAREVAESFVRIFADSEYIVSPSGSCTTMVREFYRELLKDRPTLSQAISVGERTYEFAEFLVKVAKITDVGSSFPHKVTYHDSCHALRELGLKREGRELLRHVRGLELVDLPYSEECCGFGGTFATKFPMISAAMGDTKAGNIDATGADFVTASDPSCLLHIDGILRRRNSRARTIHLASILAQTATASSSAKGAGR